MGFMMGWKDNLREASFRGVSFKVGKHDLEGGRRVVKHEFPKRDKPATEDMGRKGKAFNVDAFVLGDDYMQARDALIRACDEEGSAELIHPYLGTLKVNCEGFSMSESVEEGRVARFSLAFCESGEDEFPNYAVDVVAVAEGAADEAEVAALDDFEESFSVDGLPEFALSDVTAQFNAAVDGVKGIANTVNTIASGGVGIMKTLSDFSGSLTSLMNTPRLLATSFMGLIKGATGIFDSPFEAAMNLKAMFDFGDRNSASTTPAKPKTAVRKRQAANRDAINALVQRAAVIHAVRIAPTATFETVEDARDMRDAIANKLDSISENPYTADAVYSAIQKARAAVVAAVPPEAVSLPNLTDYTPNKTLPGLVIAYDLYEDASREAEIVTRNRIAHPGFVPGAVPLKVIADA